MITLNHDKYERELDNIAASHVKSVQAKTSLHLQPILMQADASDLKARKPKLYQNLDQAAGMLPKSVALAKKSVLQAAAVPHMTPAAEASQPCGRA